MPSPTTPAQRLGVLFALLSPSRISLPRKGCRVGLRIVLFEDCSAFTRVTACTLALSPIRDTLIEGFSHFVASMTAPIASGWSGCRVGFAPTGKRRLVTAHTRFRLGADPLTRSLRGYRACLPVGGRVLKLVPVAVSCPLNVAGIGVQFRFSGGRPRIVFRCHAVHRVSKNDVPWRADRPKDHSLALVARFKVTTAVPPPVAGVGFLYVSSSPLIAMKRF